MTPLGDLLTRARKRIEDPRAWTQGWLSTDVDGQPLTEVGQIPARWCAVGSIIEEAADDSQIDGAEDVLRAIIGHPKTASISLFNDTHTHAEVLALFDKAIAAANRCAELLPCGMRKPDERAHVCRLDAEHPDVDSPCRCAVCSPEEGE